MLLALLLATSPVQLALAQQQQDDFELLPPEQKPDADAQRTQRLLERRTQLLRLHQLGGFLTLAGTTMSAITGQINYIDKYGGGGDTGRFMTLHKVTTFTTLGVFTATGLLALLAPTPVEKPTRLDTATLHKICMATATAGMVAQAVLGIVVASKEGALSQRDFALAHQITGYVTFAAVAAGFTVLTF